MAKSLIQKIPKSSVILDCSWYLGQGEKGYQLYKEIHIPNARFYDLNLFSNQLSSFPHMIPTSDEFQKSMNQLGIQPDDHVVLYDQGLFSAPRVWWTLKQYGHQNVSVLDGGLKRYTLDGLPLTSEPTIFNQTRNYPIPCAGNLNIEYQEFIQSVCDYSKNEFTLIDARSAGRFAGSDPEPRPIPSGHAPGAINIPFGKLLNSDGTYLAKHELLEVFNTHNVDLEKPIVTMCGSGVTACIIFLALEILGAKNVRLYDGSWSEYAYYKTSPILTYP